VKQRVVDDGAHGWAVSGTLIFPPTIEGGDGHGPTARRWGTIGVVGGRLAEGGGHFMTENLGAVLRGCHAVEGWGG
jgi:hypothetical protein